VIVSESFLAAHPYLRSTAIQIAGQSLATDSSKLYESKSAIELIGSDMTRNAAKRAYEQAGITPKDVSVIELHDCFTTNEMCALEGLGLAEEGKGWKLVRDGLITYNPKKKEKGWIVNPSGGLISKGHPLGATGLAQCAELGTFFIFHIHVLRYDITTNKNVCHSLASPRMGQASVCCIDKVLSAAQHGHGRRHSGDDIQEDRRRGSPEHRGYKATGRWT
jgi:hypothetical protein